MRGHRWRGGAIGAGVAGLGVLLGAVLVAPAGADPRPSPQARQLTPIVECSAARDGSTHTVFGYDNAGGATSVAIGPSNGFSPGPADRGQPTQFVAGTRINVFTVVAQPSAPRLTWTLGGRRVQTPGPPCESTPASSTLANWGPIGAIVVVTVVLGLLLFWRTRRLRTRAA